MARATRQSLPTWSGRFHHRLDFAVNAQSHDHAAQRDRNDETFETQRDYGSDIEIRLMPGWWLPRDGCRQEDGMQGKTLMSADSRS